MRRRSATWTVIVVLAGLGSVPSAAAGADYAGAVLATPGLAGYWRLGEVSGTVAADATGQAAGTYVGGPVSVRAGR